MLAERQMSDKRLQELRRLLAIEQAKARPAKRYIEDLIVSIERLERQIGEPAYQMVGK